MNYTIEVINPGTAKIIAGVGAPSYTDAAHIIQRKLIQPGDIVPMEAIAIDQELENGKQYNVTGVWMQYDKPLPVFTLALTKVFEPAKTEAV